MLSLSFLFFYRGCFFCCFFFTEDDENKKMRDIRLHQDVKSLHLMFTFWIPVKENESRFIISPLCVCEGIKSRWVGGIVCVGDGGNTMREELLTAVLGR